MLIEVILPPREDDEVSEGLRSLTREIGRRELADASPGGFLGGEDGYGANFENDVFMMHRFCWCESTDCPWCAGCACPESAFHYFVDGAEVDYATYQGFYDELVYGPGETFTTYLNWSQKRKKATEAARDIASAKANARRRSSSDHVCRVCRGEFGNAPNFLHKASGSRVSWYKYIGRDNEMALNLPWSQIFADCMASLSPEPGN